MHIRTVCGNIKPEELGITLIHEHLYADLWTSYQGKEKTLKKKENSSGEKRCLSNLGKVRRDPSAIKDSYKCGPHCTGPSTFVPCGLKILYRNPYSLLIRFWLISIKILEG